MKYIPLANLKNITGIVSGAPAIQNGRLAGAVTPVFVNDPLLFILCSNVGCCTMLGDKFNTGRTLPDC